MLHLQVRFQHDYDEEACDEKEATYFWTTMFLCNPKVDSDHVFCSRVDFCIATYWFFLFLAIHTIC